MKLGMSAFAWTSDFADADLDILPFVRDCGFQALEIPMFDPASLAAARLRREFAAHDLECTICAILPTGVNPIDGDRTARKAAVAHLAACIETAAEIGATLIGGPLYAPIGYLPPHRPTPDEMAWAADAFQSVTGLLEASQITLSLEPVNRSETFLLRTGKEAAQLCAAIDHPLVGVTIDTFHANIEEKNIPATLAVLGEDLRHLHASENDRGVLGSGHVDFKAILHTLIRQNYTGYVVVEGFGSPHNGRPAPGTLWADAKISPESLAQESYAHLQQMLTEIKGATDAV